jgi:uncharacterized protein YbbK (DUF523 family)
MKDFFSAKPRIGISACLLGQKVRYDYKIKDVFYRTFGLHVEWIPVCPELEVGMGVPREPVRLIGNVADSRMIAERSGKDWTSAMHRFASQRVRALKELELSGYIFKRFTQLRHGTVPVYNRSAFQTGRGAGFSPAQL